ncbi:MAG: DUF4810 domain-containing protein [Muribaculaceae bacterium]
MKKYILVASLIFALSACNSTSTTPLYSWNNYENDSYHYYKNQTPKSVESLMKTYEEMIKTPRGSRKVVAPGIYAEYGYLLIQNGKVDEGITMFKNEKHLYPESAAFMDRLINKFQK